MPVIDFSVFNVGFMCGFSFVFVVVIVVLQMRLFKVSYVYSYCKHFKILNYIGTVRRQHPVCTVKHIPFNRNIFAMTFCCFQHQIPNTCFTL